MNDPYHGSACIGLLLTAFQVCSVVASAENAPPKAMKAPFDATNAKRGQEDWAGYLGAAVESTNGIGMKLRLIPPGEFEMGATPADADAKEKESPRHVVRITKPFFIGQYEVTQGEWKQVMQTEPWKYKVAVKVGANFPATHVDWEMAAEFCQKLAEREGVKYRLPTEAEWEYTCRAGSQTRFCFGDDEADLDAYGWWGGLDGVGNGADEPFLHEVGLKRPNAWGIHDMHGNIGERCNDWYSESYYKISPTEDPTGPLKGEFRATRGGSWLGAAKFQRSSCRDKSSPKFAVPILGFRVVCLPAVEQETK